MAALRAASTEKELQFLKEKQSTLQETRERAASSGGGGGGDDQRSEAEWQEKAQRIEDLEFDLDCAKEFEQALEQAEQGKLQAEQALAAYNAQDEADEVAQLTAELQTMSARYEKAVQQGFVEKQRATKEQEQKQRKLGDTRGSTAMFASMDEANEQLIAADKQLTELSAKLAGKDCEVEQLKADNDFLNEAVGDAHKDQMKLEAMEAAQRNSEVVASAVTGGGEDGEVEQLKELLTFSKDRIAMQAERLRVANELLERAEQAPMAASRLVAAGNDAERERDRLSQQIFRLSATLSAVTKQRDHAVQQLGGEAKLKDEITLRIRESSELRASNGTLRSELASSPQRSPSGSADGGSRTLCPCLLSMWHLLSC